MGTITNATWTIDELRDAFAKSEFQLEHVEQVWSLDEPTDYMAEFRLGDSTTIFQFVFDARFSLAKNFEVVRDETTEHAFAAGRSTATGD